jgi:hypothetical protein
MAAKVKIDGKQYTLDLDVTSFSLGELQFLEQKYGVGELMQFNPLEFRQMTACVAIAVKRANPELDDEQVLEKVRTVKYASLIAALDDESDKQRENAAADPPKADAHLAARANSTGGEL